MSASYDAPFLEDSYAERPEGRLWVLDAALLVISLANLTLVSTFLKYDDPRVLYNAWTYLVSVPLVLIGISLLLRMAAGRYVERSMQLAFLISVGIHLLLMVCSLNVVVFARSWRDQPEEVAPERAVVHQAVVSQYFESQASRGAGRPDHMRPVETEPAATTLEHDNAQREHRSELDHADVSTVDRSVDKTLTPFEISKAEAMPSQPSISAAADRIDRQTHLEPKLQRTGKIDLPDLERIASSPPSPSPKEDNQSRSTKIQSSAIQNDGPKIEPREMLPDRRPPLATSSLAREPSLPEIRPREESIVRQSPSVASSTRGSNPVDLSGIDPNTLATANSLKTLQPIEPGIDTIRRAPERASLKSAPSSLEADIGQRFVDPGFQVRSANRSGAGPSESAVQSALANSGGPKESPIGSSIPRSSPSPLPSTVGRKIEQPSQTPGVGDPSNQASPRPSPSELADAGGPSQGSKAGQSLARNAIDLTSGSDPMSAPVLDHARLGLSRIARELDAPDIRPSDIPTQRFQRNEVGGPTLAGSSVPIPAPAFQQRVDRNKEGRNDGSDGPLGPETEEAIERGLKFLASHQRRDGSWHLEDFDSQVQIRSDTAATALAILAFQGAGYSHRQFKYEKVVAKAIDFLVKRQRPNGDLYIRMDVSSDQNAWLYSHAIASLALCEAYGMTQDEALREPAQQAVNFMVASQDASAGGWRYIPGNGSDTSVTGWFMMALKSAQLAGLNVPRETFVRIKRWLDQSRASDRQPFQYRYNWQAPDTDTQRHGRTPTPTMTSVGLLMRLYFDWTRDTPDMQKGADYLLSLPPSYGTVAVPTRDTYYWYYTTQVLFHMGGARWEQWNGQLRPLLVKTQVATGLEAGSWDPFDEVPDAWAKFGGRLYVTTLNLLSLEVYYRHLPLYDATAK